MAKTYSAVDIQILEGLDAVRMLSLIHISIKSSAPENTRSVASVMCGSPF